MATFNADIGLEPARTPRFGGLIARVSTFTIPSGFLQASDNIRFLMHPLGAKLVDVSVVNNGSGQTVNIGDAASASRYISAAANNALTAISLVAGINFAFTADTPILGAFNTANPTAGGTITLRWSYVLTG